MAAVFDPSASSLRDAFREARLDPSTSIAANGIELAYQRFGDRSRPTMLLVMGLGAQMTGWDDGLCRMLAAHGYHVIRFDNRDAGRSTCLWDATVPNRFALIAAAMRGRRLVVPYTLRDMADDSIGLLDALDIRQAHVVGASLGAAIGQVMAMQHPRRVLSLTSIMGMTGNVRMLRPRREALAVFFARAATTEAAFIAQWRSTARVMRVGRFPDDEARDVHLARLAWLRGYNPDGKLRQFAAFLDSGNRGPALRTLDVPTLVVHGDVDPLVPLDAGRETAAVIPHATLRVMAGMGHALPMAFWPELVEAIVGHAH